MNISEWLENIERKNNDEFITYLMNEKLIYDRISCLHCDSEMILKPELYCELLSTWRCLNRSCEFYETKRSLLTDSFFSNTKVHPKKQLKAIYYLIKKNKYDDISDNVGGLDRKFIIKLKEKLNFKITEFYNRNPIRLGGPNSVVQIDETKLNFNVKSHRGRSEPADWALTIADTSVIPAKSFATMVPNRGAEAMLPIIQNVVRSNSIIYSDEWAAYRGLEATNNNYGHDTVCHKYHFVDPVSGVHTQHVESLNNKIKYDVKMQKGVRKTHRQKFLNFFLFIDQYKKEAFFEIIKLLRIN